MRRRVAADPVAGREQDRLEQRAGGALAVGAGDDDAGPGKLQAEPSGDLADALEAEFDVPGMQPLDPLEPLAQRRSRRGDRGAQARASEG
jgi:hypothetical protein